MKVYGRIADICKREITAGCLEIEDGWILAITPCDVPEDSPFIIPGFIDSHVHVESTLLTPEHYAAAAVAKGSVGAVCDPHEIANVCGMDGVDFMIANGAKTRFAFVWAASPCVPSTCFETAGACLDVDDVKKLLSRNEIFGLGEMMNVPGVLFGDAATLAKIKAARDAGKVIDGHCPGLCGDDLDKYIAAGISTDHEALDLGEGREKSSKGMKVMVREGSAACSFEAMWPLVGEYPDSTMFCSDDKYPDELACGYIDDMVRRSVAHGVSLWDVLNCACANPVSHYSLPCGLLQKGDRADFIVVNDLVDFKIEQTWIEGEKVYDAVSGGVQPALYKTSRAESVYPNRFNARPIDASALKLVPQGESIKVIEASDGSLYTNALQAVPKVVDGNVVSDPSRDILKLVVCNRYEQDAAAAIGFIKGFNLKSGAMASTIAHDSHNIIALGCSDEDIAGVINTLISAKGGIAVSDGVNTEVLPLPVAGLMSAEDGRTIAAKLVKLKDLASSIGCPFNAPFMTMAFMALPVIPELKITDKGLFDYKSFGFTGLFE